MAHWRRISATRATADDADTLQLDGRRHTTVLSVELFFSVFNLKLVMPDMAFSTGTACREDEKCRENPTSFDGR